MTDFIHEPKKEPSQEQKPSYTPPATEKERVKRVYLYSGILFAAAFLLILWSFLANRSSDRQVLDALKNNTDLLQTYSEENNAYERQIAQLEQQLSELEQLTEEQQEERERLEASLAAVEWLRAVQLAHAQDDDERARELAQQFEETHLAAYLPTEPLRGAAEGEENPSPAETYEALMDKLLADEPSAD